MNKKLSDNVINELTFLTSVELDSILEKLKNTLGKDLEWYDKITYISKHYTDQEVFPYIPENKQISQRTPQEIEKDIQDIRVCYSNEKNQIDKIVRKRGRKKNEKGTLKDRIFTLFNSGVNSYDEILKQPEISLAENTYKTILSQWRKEKGIKVKRGRKGGKNEE